MSLLNIKQNHFCSLLLVRNSNFLSLVVYLSNILKGCTVHLSLRKLDTFKVNEHNTRNYFVAEY